MHVQRPCDKQRFQAFTTSKPGRRRLSETLNCNLRSVCNARTGSPFKRPTPQSRLHTPGLCGPRTRQRRQLSCVLTAGLIRSGTQPETFRKASQITFPRIDTLAPFATARGVRSPVTAGTPGPGACSPSPLLACQGSSPPGPRLRAQAEVTGSVRTGMLK